MAELTLLMIRIRCLIEIRCVTIKTGMRHLVLIVHMALIARDCLMRARQRELCCRVVERRRSPDSRAMTRQAIMRETRQHMPRALWLIVLRLMTGKTIRVLQLVVAAHMTLYALCRRVSSRQREIRCVVIELRTIPTTCAVALSAIVTEIPLHMVRISRPGEIRLVAIPASSG